MRALFAILVACVVALVAMPVHAHAMRSGSLRIEEIEGGRAVVQLRQSVDGSGVAIVVPSDCASQGIDALSSDTLRDTRRGERTTTVMVSCPGAIAGRTFGLRGLGPILEDATLFVQFRDGRTASHLLTRGAPDWELP